MRGIISRCFHHLLAPHRLSGRCRGAYSKGRVDVVLLTGTDLYIIELKLDKSAQAAMQQINLKTIANVSALCNKPITKVGINFKLFKGKHRGLGDSQMKNGKDRR